jgi:hypothetical protein
MKLTIVLLFAISLSAFSQTKSIRKSPPLSEASPESVGLSAERLGRIDAMCREAVSKGDVPGAATVPPIVL